MSERNETARAVKDYSLLAGPLAALIFAPGVAGLAALLPGYDHVRQTVSEIGEMDSPQRVAFMAMLLGVAACLVVFAIGVRAVARNAGHSTLAAWIIGCSAISAAGVGVFAYPHPLHNVFGLSELVGYQAPLAFALTFRPDQRFKQAIDLSWVMFVLIWASIVLNLCSLDHGGELWAQVKPVYGVVQRLLFATWFGWCAILGLMLYRQTAKGLAVTDVQS